MLDVDINEELHSSCRFEFQPPFVYHSPNVLLIALLAKDNLHRNFAKKLGQNAINRFYDKNPLKLSNL